MPRYFTVHSTIVTMVTTKKHQNQQSGPHYPLLIEGLIYEDALLVFYIHSTISQLSFPLHQHHQKGRNTRRSPSRFLQRGSTAPHKVKNTKK